MVRSAAKTAVGDGNNTYCARYSMPYRIPYTIPYTAQRTAVLQYGTVAQRTSRTLRPSTAFLPLSLCLLPGCRTNCSVVFWVGGGALHTQAGHFLQAGQAAHLGAGGQTSTCNAMEAREHEH